MRKDEHGQRHLVDRVFSILDAFTAGEPRLTVSDLSRRTRLPVATVHRLAAQLANEGALDRGADGRYGIGLRMLEIARLEQHVLTLRSVALPWMLRLQEVTGSTALLCVLSGPDVVVLEQVAAVQGAVRSGVPPRQDATATAAGRLLLANRRGGSAASLALPPGGRVLARNGLAFGGTRAGGEPFSVAAPVEDESGTVVAALSIVGLAPGRERIDVARAVKRTASGICDTLTQQARIGTAS